MNSSNVVALRPSDALQAVLPPQLLQARGWLVWKLLPGKAGGKPRKVPFYVNGEAREGTQGSTEDRARLATFAEARAKLARGGYDGVGFAMLPDWNLVALDFDGCIDEHGTVNPTVAALVRDTYAETSPSGRGIRAFMEGSLPDGKDTSHEADGFGFEVFHAKGFVTVTGNELPDNDLIGSYAAPLTDAVREYHARRFEKKQRQAEPSSAAPTKADSFFRHVNDSAMRNFDAWVPALFPKAKRTGAGGWRVASEHLARDLEEDLSIDPSGIVDFGVHDMGDANDGKRSPIDLVVDWHHLNVGDGDPLMAPAPREAAFWLCEQLGTTPAELGWVTRQEILLVAGKLHEYAAECENLLSDELYVRERQLVRIGGAPDAAQQDDIRRDASQAVIIGASTQWLRRRLSERAEFKSWRRREKEWTTVECPQDLTENIAGQGDWPTLNRLETIARAPFLRVDGSICEVPGYDVEARVFYAPNGDFPSVPPRANRAQAEKALAELLEPFAEFPFATEEARSAFAASILTEAVRSAIGTAPAFFYTAPSAGTGKSLLSEMPSRIVHGTAPAMRPWADEVELRKTLFASLLAGDRTIGFDNLQDGSKVRSSALCAFLTAATYTDRKLGVSETPALPNRSVVFATGNNLNPAGDLARRSLVIRLDANLETADLRERSFQVTDLRAHIAVHRPRLLVAALTILTAHRTAGYPARGVPLPSFERWSALVRDSLTWLGMDDPVGTQLSETDDESDARGTAFRLLLARSELMQKPTFLAADVADWCGAFAGDESLGAAVGAAGCTEASSPLKVGYWLRNNRDRIASGLKLEKVAGGDISRGALWRLRALR